MPNLVNKMMVRDLESTLRDAEGMVLFSMGGLTMEQSESLRNAMAVQGVRVRMVRKTLARLAFQSIGLDVPTDTLEGTLAVAWGSTEQTISAAKVLGDSPLKKDGKVAVRAGVLEGVVLREAEALSLADIPDKDTLRAMLLGALSGPARMLATVLNAVPSGLARVVQAHVDKEGGAPDEG